MFEFAHDSYNGFNPYRVFFSIVTRYHSSQFPGYKSFNPYRVFFSIVTFPPMIRSRIGLQFQSLSGFLFHCDRVADEMIGRCIQVSIPIGFSFPLWLLKPHLWNSRYHSFNPYRVFFSIVTRRRMRSLQRIRVSIPIGFSFPLWPDIGSSKRERIEFQSLSGFLFHCDAAFSAADSSFKSVSIPIGFSFPLWQNAIQDAYDASKVSIPIGFSFPLWRLQSRGERMHHMSFNPYRVFFSIVTLITYVILCELMCFNPYRVFFSIVTWIQKQKSPGQKGFNPYRVFFSIVTFSLQPRPATYPGFNPYRVFFSIVTIQSARYRGGLNSFNPYRVFFSIVTGIP